MKLPIAILPLLVLAAPVLADDKPAQNVVSVAITSKNEKGDVLKDGIGQYGIVDTLKNWGFQVQSRVPTAWDGALKQAGVTVIAPEQKEEKKDEKKGSPPAKDEKKPPAPSFTIEGSIQYRPHKVPFYNGTVAVICKIAKVEISVRDATGKELKKIAWENLNGENEDVGEAKVLEKAQRFAVCFISRDIFKIKEIVDQVPQAKKDDFQKFVAELDDLHKEKFDPAENHKLGGDEKK